MIKFIQSTESPSADFPCTEITITLGGEDHFLDGILYEFLGFLKAVGYCFDLNDELRIVNTKEEREQKQEEEQSDAELILKKIRKSKKRRSK